MHSLPIGIIAWLLVVAGNRGALVSIGRTGDVLRLLPRPMPVADC